MSCEVEQYVGMVPKYRLSLLMESGETNAYSDTLNSPKQTLKILPPGFANEPVEVCLAIAVDIRLRPIGWVEVSRGTINSAPISPASVYRFALLCNAYGIILVHNHPSGNVSPSYHDKQMTDRLDQAGRLLGVYLVDHIILGSEGHYSFAENGEISTKY